MADKIHRLPILGAPSYALAPPVIAIPQDDNEALLRVGELARACGKTVRAIHHYENVGLLKPHKRSKGRYRLYAQDAVARVRWINKLHDMGMTLAEVQQILSTWEKAPSAPGAMAEIRAVYHQKLQEVHEQIARLSALERELHASLRYLDTCEICDPAELIDTCSACTVHDERQPEPELVAGLYACGGTDLDK
jgi:MerR family copper efflux transcriptional regulator